MFGVGFSLLLFLLYISYISQTVLLLSRLGSAFALSLYMGLGSVIECERVLYKKETVEGAKRPNLCLRQSNHIVVMYSLYSNATQKHSLGSRVEGLDPQRDDFALPIPTCWYPKSLAYPTQPPIYPTRPPVYPTGP